MKHGENVQQNLWKARGTKKNIVRIDDRTSKYNGGGSRIDEQWIGREKGIELGTQGVNKRVAYNGLLKLWTGQVEKTLNTTTTLTS